MRSIEITSLEAKSRPELRRPAFHGLNGSPLRTSRLPLLRPICFQHRRKQNTQLHPLSPIRGLSISITHCKIVDRQLSRSHACKSVGQHFIYKSPSHRKSVDFVACLNPAHPTDTMKPDGAWHPTESRHYKLDLNFDPDGRSFSRKYKHSTVAYVDALPGVVMVYAVGPAKQEWQRYLEPPRIPSLDRLIHIRTQVPFAG